MTSDRFLHLTARTYFPPGNASYGLKCGTSVLILLTPFETSFSLADFYALEMEETFISPDSPPYANIVVFVGHIEIEVAY